MKKALLVVVAAAIAAATWYVLSPSDEARVKQAFKDVAAALDKSGDEPKLDSIGRARRAVALVEPGATFEAFDKRFTLSKSVPDITQKVVAFRAMSTHLHLSFEDIAVKFTDDSTAEVTCDFFYTGDDFGWSVRDARALDATLRKDPDSGRWRFWRVRLSSIIEK